MKQNDTFFGDLSFTSLAGLYRQSKKTKGESE